VEKRCCNNFDLFNFAACTCLLSLLLLTLDAQNDPWSLTNSTTGIRAWGARYLGIYKVYWSGFYCRRKRRYVEIL
jgi:hypothetical protein